MSRLAKSMVWAMVDGLAHGLAWCLRIGAIVSGPCQRVLRIALARAQLGGRGVFPIATQLDGRVELRIDGHLTVGSACRFGPGVYLEAGPNGRILLGNHVRLNAGTLLAAHDRIEIGDDCLIGEYVSIRDTNHGTVQGLAMRTQAQVSAAVLIGRDVWIGRGSVILKGVTVGDGAVVGANSVVTHDVPAQAMVVGAPARVIGHRRAPLAPAAES